MHPDHLQGVTAVLSGVTLRICSRRYLERAQAIDRDLADAPSADLVGRIHAIAGRSGGATQPTAAMHATDVVQGYRRGYEIRNHKGARSAYAGT